MAEISCEYQSLGPVIGEPPIQQILSPGLLWEDPGKGVVRVWLYFADVLEMVVEPRPFGLPEILGEHFVQ